MPTPAVNGGANTATIVLNGLVKSGGIDVVLTGLRNNTIRFPWPDPPGTWRGVAVVD
jgi:hypothetical protein